MAQWIAGITRGHNAAVCLLKDGEVVFAMEEERLSRKKYDGGPYACMIKILEYTNKLDYLVVAHTGPLTDGSGRNQVDYAMDDVYTGLARKLGLIDRHYEDDFDGDFYTPGKRHPQVIDLGFMHHKLHAACSFYRSGFEDAVAVIVDGAGTYFGINIDGDQHTVWELETFIECNKPANFKTIWKHAGGQGSFRHIHQLQNGDDPNTEESYELIIDDSCGIVKTYEAVTQYCGWSSIEAGKTMGLSVYGNPNADIPKLYTNGGPTGKWVTGDKNVIIPNYPSGGIVNEAKFESLKTPEHALEAGEDLTLLQNRRDLSYTLQKESQEAVLNLILQAVERTGNNNVILSGGYALNCVANYYYLDTLKEKDINLYVEPISTDAGTSIGAALYAYHMLQRTDGYPYYPVKFPSHLYLGPEYSYTEEDINSICEKYNAEIKEVTNKDVVELIKSNNIVSLFQGRSENGPRALGNRSILYNPTDPDGKDHVNVVKNREYFRPFAGSILAEHVHEWFDLKGMPDSPHMMYAVECQPGIEEKIPSIIHEDGSCRIQTVTEEQNKHYYDLIKEFYNQTNIPIIFNTSFNLGGEPLVETLDDALRTLENSKIEYLYLPEYGKLITKTNN